MESRIMSENEENLRDAMNTGISGEAVTTTVEGMISHDGPAPKQVGETIQTIAEMKSTTSNIPNDEYASDFVKENSEKIKAALEDGITPEEVSKTLVNQLNKSDTKSSKRKLSFIARVVSLIKEREKRLQQSNKVSGSHQKVK